MIKTLSSLRGLLVILIVLYHVPVPHLDHPGHMGVTLFFMMSGALLAMHHPTVKTSWWQWFKPRARRIYIIHWLMLAALAALTIPLGKFKIDLTLVLNALLVHTWVPVRDVYLSYNKPTWFLSNLLTCYALYPLLSAIFNRLTLKGKWLLTSSALAIHAAIMLVVSQPIHDWLINMPAMQLAEFVLGMALGASMPAIDRALGDTVRRSATLTEAATVVLCVASCLLVAYTPWIKWTEDTVAWWLPDSVIIIVCVMLSNHEGIVGRFLSLRPFLWIGNISLEIYMVATVIPFLYSRYIAAFMGHLGYMEFYSISWPITLPLSIITAHLLHRALTPRRKG